MTSQQFLLCDNSSLANFKQWAQAISSWFSTNGWSQSSDTGQVNWSTISTVPGSGAFVYEIWQPNDGLTNFNLKMEYGNGSSTNSPSIRVSIGTSTNGAGTLTGFVTSAIASISGSYVAPSSTTQYECDFTAASGRIGALLWRTAPNKSTQYFVIERSVNSSGAYTSSHVTVIVGGTNNLASDCPVHVQQTLVFGVGAGPVNNKTSGSSATYPNLAVRRIANSNVSLNFNGSIPFDTVAPSIGYYDFPLTMLGITASQDIVEGVTFTVTLYGSTVTYMPTMAGALSQVFVGNNTSAAACAVCLRYD